jgi:hypothetical protein
VAVLDEAGAHRAGRPLGQLDGLLQCGQAGGTGVQDVDQAGQVVQQIDRIERRGCVVGHAASLPRRRARVTPVADRADRDDASRTRGCR